MQFTYHLFRASPSVITVDSYERKVSMCFTQEREPAFFDFLEAVMLTNGGYKEAEITIKQIDEGYEGHGASTH